MAYKIGSLFSGSGGFELAATMCGGVPVFASEIEPYPIAVTKSRFPNMKHLGSVTDVKGNEVEPVDVITFGSPCQDLSVAGKRAGLKHEDNGDEETTRSGLFMEAVRIIKEMREATNGVYPRFAVWENVPGAFSSNKGEDFRTVCEELIKIVEPRATMPAVPKNGWPYADCYCGEGWSLSYRTYDAQYWGVPQRRRRIYLVADFRGECAGQVSFEREGLRGYFAEGGAPGQGTAPDAEGCVGANDRKGEGFDGYNGDLTGDVSATLGVNCGLSTGRNGVIYAVDQGGGKSGANFHHDLSPTLTCTHGGEPAVAYSFDSLASNSMKSKNPHSGCRQVDIAKTLDTTDPNPCKNQGGIAIVEQVPYTLKIRSGCEGGGKGALIQTDKSATLATNNDQYLFQPVTLEPGIAQREGGHIYEGVSGTLRANAGDNQMAVAFVDQHILDDQGGQQIGVRTDGKSPTLRAEMHGNVPAVLGVLASSAANAEITDGEISPCLMARAGTGGNQLPLVAYSVENHPADSRVNLDESGKVQTLTSRMGTGGGNVPMVMEPCYCLQGNGIDRADTAGCNGKGVKEDICYTLNTIDRPAVVYGTDVGFFNSLENQSPTLLARQYKDPHLVTYPESEINYIVRRLTPTECARLQGFADAWAVPDSKEDFTDEEYRFWLTVRNTHAEINGKAVKDYTKAQMLTWYNKLHTDGSEYKLWGNGIALPTALYVMQGISDVFNFERR